MVTIQLPVPVYLKKILEVKYGEVYAVNNKSLIGLAVMGILKMKSDSSDYSYYVVKNSQRKNQFNDLTETYTLQLSISRAQRRGFELHPGRVKRIVKVIDRSIRDELFSTAILMKHLYDIEYQTTFYDFLDLYEIEENELSYEALRKDFNRKKKKISEKLLSVK